MCGKQRKRAKGERTAPKVENKNVAGNVDVVVGVHKKRIVSENLHLVDLKLFYCFQTYSEMWQHHLLHCEACNPHHLKKEGMTDTKTEKRKRLKWRDTGAESFWPARRRSYQRVTMLEWLLCHLTCRQERWWNLLNRLDRDFLRRLMDLTLFYLCAISVRALYAKRQSTSVNPAFAKKAPPQHFQCVLDHCWVIDKNVEGQHQCDDWESASNP